MTATQPPGASKGPGPKLEPEILQLILTWPFPVGSCSVAVSVVTDQNPASAKGNKGLQYEPTTCPASGKIALNDGIRVFDIADPAHPFLLLGPLSPLSLSCTP